MLYMIRKYSIFNNNNVVLEDLLYGKVLYCVVERMA